jgi:hypothetical protein
MIIASSCVRIVKSRGSTTFFLLRGMMPLDRNIHNTNGTDSSKRGIIECRMPRIISCQNCNIFPTPVTE